MPTNKKKILIVFGTRPEGIKMAPIIKLMKKELSIDLKVCVTGQHRELLNSVLNFFEIIPEFNLNIQKHNQDLSYITKEVLSGVTEVLEEFNPELVLVHGDTSTTFAATLAAFYKKISVAHIEAGLRSGNLDSPWPEEANRVLTDQISNLFFAPTKRAYENLILENKKPRDIFITGNTVIDALHETIYKINNDQSLEGKLRSEFPFLSPPKKIILVTGHRRESFGKGFNEIALSLAELSKRKDVQIIFPVHPNPKVKNPMKKYLGHLDNVYLIEPQDYLQFIFLLKESFFVITDSGGVQEEAPSLGKPVLLTRENTERPEALSSGNVRAVGANSKMIIYHAEKLLDDELEYKKMSTHINPYGDGFASKRIIDVILNRPFAQFNFTPKN
jgi:UDP-N-acetylglucosamine 2-epimerase (non-hydrolysing)